MDAEGIRQVLQPAPATMQSGEMHSMTGKPLYMASVAELRGGLTDAQKSNAAQMRSKLQRDLEEQVRSCLELNRLARSVIEAMRSYVAFVRIGASRVRASS